VPGVCPKCGVIPELAVVAREHKDAALVSLAGFEELAGKMLTQLRDLKGNLSVDRLRAADLLALLASYERLVRLPEQERMLTAIEHCRRAMAALHEAESQALDRLLTDTGLDAVVAVQAMRGKP